MIETNGLHILNRHLECMLVTGISTESLILFISVINLLQEIGLHINPQKSEAIVLDNGILTQTSINTIYGDIQSISVDERVKYLGVSFNQKLIFSSTEILSKLQSNLDTLATTHLLQSL